MTLAHLAAALTRRGLPSVVEHDPDGDRLRITTDAGAYLLWGLDDLPELHTADLECCLVWWRRGLAPSDPEAMAGRIEANIVEHELRPEPPEWGWWLDVPREPWREPVWRERGWR